LGRVYALRVQSSRERERVYQQIAQTRNQKGNSAFIYNSLQLFSQSCSQGKDNAHVHAGTVEAHLRTLYVDLMAVDAEPPNAASRQSKHKWNTYRPSAEVVAWGLTKIRKCAAFYYFEKGDDDYMAGVY